jgi:hypothetical protein
LQIVLAFVDKPESGGSEWLSCICHGFIRL